MPGSSGFRRWCASLLTAAGIAAAPAAIAATVALHPGDDVAAIVNRSPAGTEFRFGPGLYRLVQVSPKDGDSFVGDHTAVLSGAQPVSGFTRDGDAYVATVAIKRPSIYYGECETGRVCAPPNDVFVDGVRQEPAPTRAAVGPDHVWLDYGTGKLYLGSDPAGKTVELATAQYAFAGPGEGVRIAGLVIEKYANEAQSGVIGGRDRRVHWTIENCTIQDNHGWGVEVGPNEVVAHNIIRRNGQLGIGGSMSHVAILDNDISENNTAGFLEEWEDGGIKLTRTLHALIRNNYVHDNHGPGIWADMDDVDNVYQGNRIENNDGQGITLEISWDAAVLDNRVRGNGRRPHVWIWGAQIIVQNSRDVTVRGNRVGVPDAGKGIILIEAVRPLGLFGPHVVRDCTVSGNTIELTGKSGIAAGAVTDYRESQIARDNNRFDGNTYRVPDPAGHYWGWGYLQGTIGFDEFRHGDGQEPTGKIETVRDP